MWFHGSAYIRTYRNELSDWVSRADLEEVSITLQAPGWTEVPFRGDWKEIVADDRCGPLVLPSGQDDLEVVAGRSPATRSVQPPPLNGWLDSQGPTAPSSAVLAMSKHGVEPTAREEKIWASLFQDPRGLEWDRVRRRLEGDPCAVVILDFPILGRLTFHLRRGT